MKPLIDKNKIRIITDAELQQFIKANEAAANSKKVDPPSKNLLESSISQVVSEFLKKNYADYIITDNDSIILYKTKNKNSNQKN